MAAHQTAPQQVLDLDVLHLVMTSLSRSDVPSMMLCCRSTYAAGVPLLLSKFPIFISDNDSRLESFFSFILDHTPPRSQYLRDLTYERTSKRLAQTDHFLTAVFSGARNLQSLRIRPFPHREELKLPPSLCNAISGLASLHTFEIIGTGNEDYTTTMLAQMRSPLSSITIDFSSDAKNGLPPRDVLPLIANSFTSLEHLQVLYMRFGNPRGDGAVFARLRTLSAHMVWCHHLRPVIHSFPNLLRLSILNTAEMQNQLDLESIAGLRRINQDFQRTKRWAHLEEVRADIFDLYRLGLRSEVQKLILDQAMVKRDTLDMFQNVLQDLHPSKLSFSVHIRSTGTVVLQHELWVHVPHLTHLKFDINLTNAIFDISALLYGVTHMIKSLPTLVFLSLTFTMDDTASSNRAYIHLIRLDPALFANNIIWNPSTSTQLRLFALKLPVGDPSFWEKPESVADLNAGGTNQGVQRLDEAVGRERVRQEGFFDADGENA